MTKTGEGDWRDYTTYCTLPLVDGKLIRDVPPESREQIQERLQAAREECERIEKELER